MTRACGEGAVSVQIQKNSETCDEFHCDKIKLSRVWNQTGARGLKALGLESSSGAHMRGGTSGRESAAARVVASEELDPRREEAQEEPI